MPSGIRLAGIHQGTLQIFLRAFSQCTRNASSQCHVITVTTLLSAMAICTAASIHCVPMCDRCRRSNPQTGFHRSRLPPPLIGCCNLVVIFVSQVRMSLADSCVYARPVLSQRLGFDRIGSPWPTQQYTNQDICQTSAILDHSSSEDRSHAWPVLSNSTWSPPHY